MAKQRIVATSRRTIGGRESRYEQIKVDANVLSLTVETPEGARTFSATDWDIEISPCSTEPFAGFTPEELSDLFTSCSSLMNAIDKDRARKILTARNRRIRLEIES
jgi:hypothetical protein